MIDYIKGRDTHMNGIFKAERKKSMATLSFRALRGDTRTVPVELRSNFRHLYLDILWYGCVWPAVQSRFSRFMLPRSVPIPPDRSACCRPRRYQPGLSPLPTGHLLESRPIGPAVFWSSVFHTLLLPDLGGDPLVAAATRSAMAIHRHHPDDDDPGHGFGSGFQRPVRGCSACRMARPRDRRSQCGALGGFHCGLVSLRRDPRARAVPHRLPDRFRNRLSRRSYEQLSSWRLSAHFPMARQQRRAWHRLGDLASPGGMRSAFEGTRTSVGERFLTCSGGKSMVRLEIFSGPFGMVIAGLFFFHLAQYLAIPLFPLYWVNKLNFSDGLISQGQALFYAVVFIRLNPTELLFPNALDTYSGVGTSACSACAAYPAVTSIMQGPTLYSWSSCAGRFGLVDGGWRHRKLHLGALARGRSPPPISHGTTWRSMLLFSWARLLGHCRLRERACRRLFRRWRQSARCRLPPAVHLAQGVA